MAYETLQHCKFLNITQMSLRIPLIEANYGDGYGAAVIAGNAAGLHKWVLSAQVLPDMTPYTITSEQESGTVTEPRFTYLYEFFKRHIAAGNKPFLIAEPRTNKTWLVSFEGDRLDIDVITAKLFAGGITLKQRRASDLNFNADGSVVMLNPPLNPIGFENPDNSITWSVSPPESGAPDEYELEISLI